jgi:ferredoxin
MDTPDGLADPVKNIIDESEFEENKEAADVCPVSIIHVDEIK